MNNQTMSINLGSVILNVVKNLLWSQTNYRIYASLLKGLLIVYCLLHPVWATAQIYPVQVTPQLVPPYSFKLSDYATTTQEKLFVNLLLTDARESGRQVRLKMYVEGPGMKFQTLDFVSGMLPIILDGGVNQRLTNLDLQPYFDLNNLVGITPKRYGQQLPEGQYRFCFEVYDQFSGQRISNRSCANIFLVLNDPPLLNVPFRGDLVTARDPQNLVFNWTPRHFNAGAVQYEFTLKELWDTGMDPQAAFMAGPPLYQTTTFANTLHYGPAQIPLLEGKTYGWQVRAFVGDGITETSLFRNNGLSEVYHFAYRADCHPPRFVLSEAQNSQTVTINWQMGEHVRYRVQYRKKGHGDSDWFGLWSQGNETTIRNLEAGTVYEFRVGGDCNPLPVSIPTAGGSKGEEGGLAFSPIHEFTTPTEDEMAYYNCGIPPEIEIKNQEPLQNLGVNEVFMAGDFPIIVKYVNYMADDGRYSGWGTITVPYLADTNIRVEFDNIRINTDYQLVEGMVETNYDPNWNNTVDISNELLTLEELAQDVLNAINEAFANGSIGESERDAQLAETKALILELEQAKEELEQGEKLLEEESPEKKEEGKQSIASAEQTTKQVGEQLREKARALGVEAESGSPVKDSYFDALLPISVNGEGTLPINILDGNGTFVLNLASNDTVATIEPRTFTIDGDAYTFYITSSKSGNADIATARQAVDNPTNGIVVYLHYDLVEEVMGYKVEFAQDHFGNLSKEEREEVRFTFKKGIANLIEAYQAAQEVEDWSVVVSESVQKLNGRLKDAVGEMAIPEEIWDRQTYPNEPEYLESFTTGLADGVLEEVANIPLLLSLVVDYTTDTSTRDRINTAIANIDVEEIIENFVQGREELYIGGNPYRIKHQTGKDVVAVGTLLGTGGAASLGKLKKGVEFVEELAEKLRRYNKDDVIQAVRKVIYPTVKINGVTVVRIMEGTNNKIALMGRKMSYIEEVEKALINIGKDVEIFDAKKAFGGKGYNNWNAIKNDWDYFVNKYGVLKNNVKVLPYDKVKQTLWYQENMRWAKWIKEKGFEIYDLGDNPGLLKNSPDRSAFYDLEKEIIFND